MKIFLITIGLYQESTLSLIAIVIDDLTRHIQNEVPSVLFLDDIVLIGKTRVEINYKEVVESKGFKLRELKINILEFKFSNRRQRN